MKSELTAQMREWMEQDADAFEPSLSTSRKAAMRKLPLYMLISIAGFCALGVAAGAGISGILRLHLPIGIGLALFIALFTFWQQSAIINKKIVVKAYERGASAFFNVLPEEEQALFCHQMSERRYEEIIYQEKQIPFQSKIIIGADYWVYRNAATSFYAKAGDVKRVYLKTSNARVTYDTASSHVKKRVAIGVELVVEYKEDSVMTKPSDTVMYFDDNGQAAPVLALIQKYCPHISVQ